MKFYKLNEIPNGPEDQVFRVSPIGNGVATFIAFGISITALMLAIEGWKPSGMTPGACYYFAAVFGLLGLIPLGMFRASLKPSSWLVRCGREGVFMKYRSYENWRLPADTLQAVGFTYGEIAWAKIVKERRISPDASERHGNQTNHLTYIDLGLVNPDTSELDVHLRSERNLQPDGKIITLDYPMQTLPNGIVELRWKSIHPSIHKAMQVLGQRVKILEAESRNLDLTHHRRVDSSDDRAKIIQLAKDGYEMVAVRLAQEAYGYSLSQAQEFVDKLLEDK